MELPEILFHTGSASMILVGLGHTVGELTSNEKTLPEDVQDLVASMKGTYVQMPGRKVALFDMMRGFSLMMGIALIVIGTLNHLTSAYAVQSNAVLLVNIMFSIFGVVISIRYFFIFPVIFMSLTAVCYSAVFFL
jgi:hypothetical protein